MKIANITKPFANEKLNQIQVVNSKGQLETKNLFELEFNFDGKNLSIETFINNLINKHNKDIRELEIKLKAIESKLDKDITTQDKINKALYDKINDGGAI